MTSRELSILVTAKNLSSRILGQVKGDINGLDNAARRAGSNMGRNIGIGIAAVGAGMALQVRAGIDSLVELERVNNLTAAALLSTGDVAGQSVEGIRARSEAMETLTGVDDKVIQNAQNLLLTFRNIGEDAFEPAAEAALNLNAALGGGDEGLQGALILVAKAVNDPLRGLGRLERVGVSFTQAQKDQIKEMVAANDLMGAQGVILGELETQFGGAAEAANEGIAGDQKAFTDAIEDMQMALATGFLPLIQRVSATMQGLVADPAFLAGVEEFGETMAGGFDAALDFAEGVDWGAVGDAFGVMGSGAKAAMDMFLGAPPWLQTAIITGWGLNKLTGGALGSIVGELGKGLVKGVLGMNAGVVNVKGAVVNAPGGPGVGGGRGGTGRTPFLPLAAGVAGAVAVPLMLTGSEFVVPGSDTDRMREIGAQLDRGEITQAEYTRLLREIRDGQPPQTAEQRRTTEAANRAQIAINAATPWAQRTVAGIHSVNASEENRFHVAEMSKNAQHAQTIGKEIELLSSHRFSTAILQQIRDKVGTTIVKSTVNVSLQEWQRQSTSSSFASRPGI